MISTTQQDLLRAVAHQPEDDTVRLAYADYLDENATGDSDRARAELIRVQCWRSQTWPIDNEGERRLLRADELIRLHEAAWRRPPCPKCKGERHWFVEEPSMFKWHEPVKRKVTCPTCKGTGSTGPLSEGTDIPNPVNRIKVLWAHVVTWLRGFPVVRCRLDECGEEESCPHIVGGECRCGGRTGVVWTPTPWAVRCVREGASFEVTDRQCGFGDHYASNMTDGRIGKDWGYWYDTKSGAAYINPGGETCHHVPGEVAKEMVTMGGVRFVNGIYFEKPAPAINAAILRLVVRAAYPSLPQGKPG